MLTPSGPESVVVAASPEPFPSAADVSAPAPAPAPASVSDVSVDPAPGTVVDGEVMRFAPTGRAVIVTGM